MAVHLLNWVWFQNCIPIWLHNLIPIPSSWMWFGIPVLCKKIETSETRLCIYVNRIFYRPFEVSTLTLRAYSPPRLIVDRMEELVMELMLPVGRKCMVSKGNLVLLCISWLVGVFAWPIIAEDISEQISDLKNKLCCDCSIHTYIFVTPGQRWDLSMPSLPAAV